MYLFCPTCQSQFPAAGRCPRCSSRLLSPGESADLSDRGPRPPAKPKTATFGGRVAVGGVIALGAHLGLREWSVALLALLDAPEAALFVVGLALRVVAGFAGGMFAGAGREAPFGGGLAVGVIGGLAWLLVDPYPDVVVDPMTVGLTGLVVAASGVGALFGGRVWPPAVVLEEPEDSRGSSLLKLLPMGRKAEAERPTHWWKVVLSAALVLAAVAGADYARQGLRKACGGAVGGGAAAPRTDFEIAVAGVAPATLVAGLNTGAGLRHGLFAGVFASAGVVALFRAYGEGAFPALDFLAEHLVSDTPGKLALALGSIFFLTGLVGGWMGGQLMPPLRRRSRLLPPR